MAYTTIDNPELYFQVKIYTGDGNDDRAITFDGEENMQPDMCWFKERNSTSSHAVYDAVRGVNKDLSPDTDAAEATDAELDALESFDSNGFTISDDGKLNQSASETYVAWCWKAGGSTASNSSGDITSTVSVDTTAGFSITSYTGNNSNDQTVGHSLSAVPHLMIIKNRDDTNGWIVYHHKNTSAPETDYLGLNGTGATTDDDGIFDDTAPTSTLFTIGDESDVGAGTGGNTEKIIAYLWCENQGFSISTYTGTGSTTTIGHGLGAVPGLAIFKSRSAVRAWMLYHKGNTSAPETEYLLMNTNDNTTDNDNFTNDVAPTSTVFTIDTFNEVNTDSATYVAYMWLEKQGYSRFGSYTGNGDANGTFVYTGLRAAWVMIKETSASGDDWYIFDNKRDGFNGILNTSGNRNLRANQNQAETGTDENRIDILSNGFKVRDGGGQINGDGVTYIYTTFAEQPFVNSNGVPANAR